MSLKDFWTRIKAIEAKILPATINLYMADGSTKKIPGGSALLDLLSAGVEEMGDGPITPAILEKYPALGDILNSSASSEPGHLIGLFKALAKGPDTRRGA